MQPLQTSLVSKVMNSSLELADDKAQTADVRASALAQKLLGDNEAVLRIPAQENFISKIIRYIRNAICTEKWCLYSDVKSNLSQLASSLQNQEVSFNVTDSARQYTLRKNYHSDAKEVFSQVALALSAHIKGMGLEDAKKEKLQEIVGTIEKRLASGVVFKENFLAHESQSKKIEGCIKALDEPRSNLKDIRNTLQTMKWQEGDAFTNLAIEEELSYAFSRLEQKERIQEVKETLFSTHTVGDLFQVASDCMQEYLPKPKYKEELQSRFNADVQELVKARTHELIEIFEKESTKCVHRMGNDFTQFIELQNQLENIFQDIELPDNKWPTLQDAKRDYHTKIDSLENIPRAYLKVFKKQLKREVGQFNHSIETETSLKRLAQFKQSMNSLNAIIDYFENAVQRAPDSSASKEVASLIEDIKERLEEVEYTLDKKIQKQALQDQKAIEQEVQSIDKTMREGGVKIVIGGKEHVITPIQTNDASEYSISGIGVALSVLKWGTIFGQPVADMIEGRKNIRPSDAETTLGNALVGALAVAYVVFSGKSLFGSAATLAPIFGPTIAADYFYNPNNLRVVPRPIKWALGMVVATGTAYAFHRGVTGLAWDAVSYGAPYIFWKTLGY